MKLIFERGEEGQFLSILPKCDVPVTKISDAYKTLSRTAMPVTTARTATDKVVVSS